MKNGLVVLTALSLHSLNAPSFFSPSPNKLIRVFFQSQFTSKRFRDTAKIGKRNTYSASLASSSAFFFAASSASFFAAASFANFLFNIVSKNVCDVVSP